MCSNGVSHCLQSCDEDVIFETEGDDGERAYGRDPDSEMLRLASLRSKKGLLKG